MTPVPVPVSPQILLAARERAHKMGRLHGSFTGGAGNLTGMIGELAAHSVVGGELVGDHCTTHDIVLPDGRTLDVKSKSCTCLPKPEYTASVVADRIPHCDLLLFARVHADLFSVWLCGWMPVLEFRKRAKYVKKGTRDGNFVHRVNGLHVPLSVLKPMARLLR